MSLIKSAGVSSSKRMLYLQSAMGLLIFIVVFAVKGQWSAMSALYGVAVAMLMAFILAKSIAIATKMPAAQVASSMIVLYMGAVIRFVLVLVLLGTGLWWLKVEPLPMLISFAVVQFAYPLLMKKQR